MEYKITTSQKTFFTEESMQKLPLWNQGVVVFFSASYHYEQLNQALNKLIETHEHLRVRFKIVEGQPSSHVESFQFTQYPFYYFSSMDEVFNFSENFVNEPLDFSGQLFHCAIFSAPQKTGIMICAHHILIDGYSTQIMLSFLNAFLQTGQIPEVPVHSYADYIALEHHYLSSKRHQRDLEYWKNIIHTHSRESVFSKSNAIPDYSCDKMETSISAELFCQIDFFCQKHHISMASFFCAVLSIYIREIYGKEQFTLGIPVLNRTTRTDLNSIGLYMHILPLAVSVTNESFLCHTQNIEFEKMNLFRHEKMTQSQILSLLNQKTKASPALFDIVFDYQTFSESPFHEFYFLHSNALSVPLEIHVHTFHENDHRVTIRYRKNYFHYEEIPVLWDHIIAIATHALQEPATLVKNISLRNREDILKFFNQFNSTFFDYGISDNETIYSLFEKTALQNRTRTCFTACNLSITFGEFLEKTQALDLKIREFTKGQKEIIAILAERSVEMYTGIYGAIRGGNAYLPISPDDPPERIRFILENSGAAVVLTQDKFIHLAGNVPFIDLTNFFNSLNDCQICLPCNAQPDDTAYIIYTSGSTGNPKGVKINHRSLLNRILWMQDLYPVDKNSVILQKTPYTFDVSLWEIFWWGICGCSMAASKPQEHFLPVKILNEISEHKITHLHFVPSVFDLFLSYLEANKDLLHLFASVKHVFLSGEVLCGDLIQRFYSLFTYPIVKLHNLYGPTECTIDVTSYDCKPDDTDPVPIGKPIYNTSIYILDSKSALLPKGKIGELCVGGVNVGQGYLNNPELTSEKYTNNPFSTGNIYHTGDYAYIRDDNQIIFCGRIDGQRKLNGQRIELGEIEQVIKSNPHVTAVVVDIRKHMEHDLLIAYYCGIVSEQVLKNYCETLLPTYMIPSIFLHLEQMPLTPNGKLDRKALDNLPLFSTVSNNAIPKNKEEALALNSFRHILQTNTIDRSSNFFTLGGTSLSMIELLSEKPFSAIDASEFIKDPTPAGLAKCLLSTSPNSKKHLFCLREGTMKKNAVILFPYAGGGAEAYAELILAADQTAPELAIFYADYPHTIEDCMNISNELEALSQDYVLFFYSHCAGSAAALQIINLLEERELFIVSHFIAGANIPAQSPSKNNFWQTVSDSALKNVLVQAGASIDTLSNEQITHMLSQFRTDTDFYTNYFFNSKQKIHCPFSLVLSKQDLFTENYNDAAVIWNQYTDAISELHYIDDSSHYFQSTSAKTLMKILSETINCADSRPT